MARASVTQQEQRQQPVARRKREKQGRNEKLTAGVGENSLTPSATSFKSEGSCCSAPRQQPLLQRGVEESKGAAPSRRNPSTEIPRRSRVAPDCLGHRHDGLFEGRNGVCRRPVVPADKDIPGPRRLRKQRRNQRVQQRSRAVPDANDGEASILLCQGDRRLIKALDDAVTDLQVIELQLVGRCHDEEPLLRQVLQQVPISNRRCGSHKGATQEVNHSPGLSAIRRSEHQVAAKLFPVPADAEALDVEGGKDEVPEAVRRLRFLPRFLPLTGRLGTGGVLGNLGRRCRGRGGCSSQFLRPVAQQRLILSKRRRVVPIQLAEQALQLHFSKALVRGPKSPRRALLAAGRRLEPEASC
eukprot:scaffold602_cov298-Pinguiococcus_pyrenoidosus.AAC.20